MGIRRRRRNGPREGGREGGRLGVSEENWPQAGREGTHGRIEGGVSELRGGHCERVSE